MNLGQSRLMCWLISITLFAYSISSVANTDSVEQPNLLEPLFAQNVNKSLKLSPDGLSYIVAESSEESATLVYFASDTGTLVQRHDLTDSFEQDIILKGFEWLDNKHVAATFIAKSDVETTLLERNAQTKLIIYDVTSAADAPLIYQVSTAGYLVEAAPQSPNIFYFARSGHKSKVYKIMINKLLKVGQKRNKLTRADGGQFTERNVIANVDGYAMKWFFKPKGDPLAVLKRKDADSVELAVYTPDVVNDVDDVTSEKENTEKVIQSTVENHDNHDNHGPKVIKSWKDDEFEREDENAAPLFLPMAIANDQRRFYCRDYREDEALTLYLVDFENGTEEKVYESSGLPIVDLIFTEQGDAVGVTLIEQGLYKESYFDGQPSKAEAEQLQVTTSISVDGQTRILYRESHNQPGAYFLQQGTSNPKRVSRQFDGLPDILATRQVTDTVSVDNLDVPYILTLPDEASPTTPVPMILLPHGGPFSVYDTQYFSNEAQFFAANGYAVLRVNFRGSGGYGLDYKNAGKKQWGDLMIKDITSALRQVQSRSDINPKNTCVVGMSYGGYAAQMLSLQSPELLACAVSVAGVSDINLFLRNPKITEEQQTWLSEHVGGPHKDYEALKQISPLYRMSELAVPIKLIHGAKDRQVRAEHSYRVKWVLQNSDIPFEWSVFDNADHHFAKDDQHGRLFSTILTFVQQHTQAN